MSLRPTGYPEWASASSSTGITEPPANTKAIGWRTNDQPPASYLNWLQEKTYRWINYLDPRSWSVVIEDDFPSDTTIGAGTTGLRRPPWFVRGNSSWVNMYSYGWDGNFGTDGSIGTVILANGLAIGGLASSPSGFVDIHAAVGFLGNRDWRMEFIARSGTGTSGTSLEIGLFQDIPFANVRPTGIGIFIATGASPFWGFRYLPTGAANPTQIGCSVTPSAYHKLAFERQGLTAYIEVDDVLLATIPGMAFGNTAALDFGMLANRGGAGSTLMTVELITDWASLRARRGPT